MTSPAPSPPFTELSARRLGPVRRFFVRHPVLMDVVVAAWFLLASVGAVGSYLEAFAAAGVPDDHPRVDLVVAVGVGVSLLATAALMWRRRVPVLVTAVMTVLAVVVLGTTGTMVAFDLGIPLALYAVAASRPPRVTWLVFGVAFVLAAGAAWMWAADDLGAGLAAVSADAGSTDPTTGSTGAPTPGLVRILTSSGLAVSCLLAIAIGTSVRNRRLHLADLVERANALARDRDQQARLARAEERSRIAREMHDVVAHSLSVMIALADGAGAALTRAPDRSRAALDELAETGRTALGDMRRVLGVLEDGVPFEPQPGHHELAGLVERFRHAGLPVRTTGLGTPLPDDTGLQLALYRITAEALTNTLRHAPGTPWVEVRLERTDDAVVLEVVDGGATVPRGDPGGAGRGLIGMQERVAVYGGTVEAGPTTGAVRAPGAAPAAGWRVRAVLPWDDGGGR